MRFLRFSIVFIFVLVVAFTVTSAGAQTVSGKLKNATVARGSVIKGEVLLSLPEGLHVNSNKPKSEYAIATVLRITAPGLKPATIAYPEGEDKKFQFSETELNVYEGEVSIPFTLAVPRAFRAKTVSIKAVLRYQACTNEVCYPPRNKEVVLSANIR